MIIKCKPLSKTNKIKTRAKIINNDNSEKMNFFHKIPIRIKTTNENLIHKQVIKETDNENTSSEKVNSSISSIPENRLLSIPTNLNNNQDMDYEYLHYLNNARKIHPERPYIDEIKNIENDQLKNISTEEILESEFESENIQEIDPYISSLTSALNKNKLFNSKYKNNNKNKKNLMLNRHKFLKGKSGKNNNNNNKNFNKLANYNRNNINDIQNGKKAKKNLGHFKTNAIGCRNMTLNYLFDKNHDKNGITEDLISRNALGYSVDYLKKINSKSRKKNGHGKIKTLKPKKIENFKYNEVDRFNSDIIFAKKYLSIHCSKISKNVKKNKNKNKEKEKISVPKKNTCNIDEFSLLKHKLIKLNTFNNDFKINSKNNVKMSNKINNKSKSNHLIKNDKCDYNSIINYIKTKKNKYLMRMPAIKRLNKKFPNSVNKNGMQSRYKSNPFINNNFNLTSIGNESNNNTVLSRIIPILDKKLGYINKTNHLYNVKIKNLKLVKK